MAKATRKEINLLVAFKSLHEKAPMEINWKLKLLMKKQIPLGHNEITWHKDKCSTPTNNYAEFSL